MLGRRVSTVLSDLKGARIIKETSTSIEFEFNNKYYIIENSPDDYKFVRKQAVLIVDSDKKEFSKLCDRLIKRGYVKFDEKREAGSIIIKYNYKSKKSKKYLMRALVMTSPENNQTGAYFEWGNWSN
jgi:hypothetical protein